MLLKSGQSMSVIWGLNILTILSSEDNVDFSPDDFSLIFQILMDHWDYFLLKCIYFEGTVSLSALIEIEEQKQTVIHTSRDPILPSSQELSTCIETILRNFSFIPYYSEIMACNIKFNQLLHLCLTRHTIEHRKNAIIIMNNLASKIKLTSQEVTDEVFDVLTDCISISDSVQSIFTYWKMEYSDLCLETLLQITLLNENRKYISSLHFPVMEKLVKKLHCIMLEETNKAETFEMAIICLNNLASISDQVRIALASLPGFLGLIIQICQYSVIEKDFKRGQEVLSQATQILLRISRTPSARQYLMPHEETLLQLLFSAQHLTDIICEVLFHLGREAVKPVS
jgi:hypothetical protein